VGVTAGQPDTGVAGGWPPVAPHEMTDRVREPLRTKRVDPIPPFAAGDVSSAVLPRVIGYWTNVDAGLGSRVAHALGVGAPERAA
jgi:hypothetical protein